MTTIAEVASRYWQAEASRDIDAILGFFTDDAEWIGPGVDLKGRDQIRTFYERSAAAFPGLEVEVGRVLGGDQEAAIEWSALFTDHSGKQYPLAGINVMRLEGNQIASLTTHHDPSSLAGTGEQVTVADRFSGATVLVTGAGSGIGAATVRQFVSEGALVTGVDINGEGLDRVRASLGGQSDSFRTIVADITDPIAQTEIVAKATDPVGALDVLVNNAAVFLLSGLKATADDWRRTLDVNLVAPAQLVAAAFDSLRRSRLRAVVNIASISGHVSQAGRWTYNASKGGVLELTRCQALDLAPHQIRVNSISPGYIWTEVLDRAAEGDRDKWEPIWGAFCPMRRCGEPSEIAAAVAFLASPAASFITGTDLLVDGGLVSMSPDGQATYEFS